MNPISLLHLLSAAFLTGVGSTMFIFTIIIRAVKGDGQQNWFLRIVVFCCFACAIYLTLSALPL